jgi:hypothetical protein
VLVHRPTVERIPTMLVRPDGYVAWAADNPQTAALQAAITQWCG